jgi:cob(I)alamin adenosyltransferase
MKITTKTGDAGMTSLRSGLRVSKDDARIELNGEIDELNSILGWCKVVCATSEPFETLQKELMTCMTVVACYEEGGQSASACEGYASQITDAVARMEGEIARLTPDGAFTFVLPGQSERDAVLHIARTKARTCERRLVTLNRVAVEQGNGIGSMPQILNLYLNRLSDYLYCLTL